MKRTIHLTTQILAILCGTTLAALTIPASHPRLWWNTERLAQAKAWYATHPFTPNAGDPFGNAFRYVLTGETTYARAAINWLLAYQLPAGQVLPTAIGCDNCRWDGEDAMVVFDWCYDQLTPAERTTIIARWNTDLANVNKQTWGGVGMEGNNYYWGNLRNSLEWGIATTGDNAQAQSFIDHALVTRWQNSFLPYAATGSARGGALGEGPGYGCTMLAYPIIPFVTAALNGRDILRESAFFQEAAACVIYSTTPCKTNAGYHDFFPYNETEIDDIIHSRAYFGDFMMTMANQWNALPVGQYCRQWVMMCNPGVSKFIASVNQNGPAKSFASLPLDYYAPGCGYFYSRASWDTAATALMVQMKWPDAVGHEHVDWGNFQLFRKGRWLTRESPGYAVSMNGIEGGQVDASAPDAHNTIFVGPAGSIGTLRTRGPTGFQHQVPPKVKRVASRPEYGFAVVDLTGCYRSNDHQELFDNVYAGRIVREYLFVRPLETLIVFDRLLAGSGSVPASSVVKTVLIHAETNPALQDANHALVTVGNQAMRLSTLAPAAPAYAVDNEGANGQYRLAIKASGAAQSYCINVLQARDAGGADITAGLVEDNAAFRVSLSHPTLGTALIVFLKGDTSAGGAFGYALTGNPVTAPLSDTIQGITVSDNGVTWSGTQASVIDAEPTRRTATPAALRIRTAGSAIELLGLPDRLTKSELRVSLISCNGQSIDVTVKPGSRPGVYRIETTGHTLSAGRYLLRCSIGAERFSAPVLILK